MPHINCVVFACKINSSNRPPGVTFHPCPSLKQIRKKWYTILRSRCLKIDWSRSMICSKHFENKCFDSERNLKDTAVPSLFPVVKPISKNIQKERVDRLLINMTQADLISDIKTSFNALSESRHINNYFTDDFECKPEASTEAQMWLLIKKQNHLIARLMRNQNHKNLQKSMADSGLSKKDTDQGMETYKYIIKCLQEKLATSEEQVEILTAVESR